MKAFDHESNCSECVQFETSLKLIVDMSLVLFAFRRGVISTI